MNARIENKVIAQCNKRVDEAIDRALGGLTMHMNEVGQQGELLGCLGSGMRRTKGYDVGGF